MLNYFMRWLRRDGLAVAGYALATIVMTYPVAFRLNNGWVVAQDIDTWVRVWDHWWFGRIVAAGSSPLSTNLLFFPVGIDLTFHSISWTISALIWLLSPLLGQIGAYNFTVLIAVFTTAYGGYLLIRTLVKHRAAAWLGGAIYSFAPYHIAHTGAHSDLTHLAAVPIAALLLSYALRKNSRLAALGAAGALMWLAYTGLYMLVFAFMTLALVLMYTGLEQRRWQTRGFWRSLGIFGAASTVLLTTRFLPIVQSSAGLSAVIEEKYSAGLLQTDLLAFVLPSRYNPLLGPFFAGINSQLTGMSGRWPPYLGVLPLMLMFSAATWKRQRKPTYAWLGLGFGFLILSLGPVLRFNGVVYDTITLPAAYLAWFPLVRAFARPDYFVLGLLLPLGVVAAIGFDRWLLALTLSRRRQTTLVILASLVLLLEYWNGEYPFELVVIDPFYQQLAQSDPSLAVIELPMGRQLSKIYMYHQTFHHHPIVEGLSARTLPEAYRYIDASTVLSRWKNDEPLDCRTLSAASFQASIDQMISDGIGYVIVHRRPDGQADPLVDYFHAAPVYRDDELAAYTLQQLRAAPPCS